VAIPPGSAELDDFRVQFDVPWRDLLAGKPVAVKVPSDAAEDSADKGTWTITFTPKNAGK
jgi:hypothetical protein